MKLREDGVTVTTMDKLPTTDKECHNCEDGTFVRDGHELICDRCSYSPSFAERRDETTEWDLHERQVRQALEDGERPRLVGGYPEAYWGEGEYEYTPVSGFSR